MVPVVLLHGQPGSAADWAGVVAELGEAAPVIAPDRPGWDGRRPAAGLEGNAQAVIEALDAIGAPEAVVAGHSLGGTIAAWLAATRPDRVRALVLAAPAANAESLYWFDRWLAAPVAGELSAAVSLAATGLVLALPPLRRRVATAAGVDPDYLQRSGERIRRPSAWRSYSAEQRTLVREIPQLERRLGAISAPTQILAGSADHVVPGRSSVALAAAIPGAQLQILEGAGHLLPQTRPREIAAAIAAMLSAGRASTLGGA